MCGKLFGRFVWQTNERNATERSVAQSHSHFTPEEQNILPPAVRDFLHLVGRTGEIQFAERERLIHALMNLPDDEITVENAKLLMLIRLNNAVDSLSLETGEKLLNVFDDKTIVH